MNPYDTLPYGHMAYWETHPDRLSFIAHLFGLAPAPVSRCRVLEVGCASGANLIPIAELNPGSRFVGIDLAASQIEEGRATAAAVGLGNLELRAEDLVDFRDAPEGFDYVIAHGVYSWVEPRVAGALLDLVARHLAPGGVALVSHYVKPGWYARAHARDVMLWQARRVADEDQRVAQARKVLELVVSASRAEDAMQKVLAAELARARGLPDWYLRHDHLAEENHACYFGEMVRELERRGLVWLGDADLGTMLPEELPPDLQAAVAELAPAMVDREELTDHLRFRTFRMTLVCRDGAPIDRVLSPSRLAGTHLLAPPGSGDGPAVARLVEAWPRSVPFDDCPRAHGRELLRAVVGGKIRAQLAPARCVAPAPEKPLAALHARVAAAASTYVTNLHHNNVQLGPEARRLLARLDGTRDRPSLAAELGGDVDVMIDQLASLALVLGA